MIGGCLVALGLTLAIAAVLIFGAADGDRREVAAPALAIFLVGGVLVLAGFAAVG